MRAVIIYKLILRLAASKLILESLLVAFLCFGTGAVAELYSQADSTANDSLVYSEVQFELDAHRLSPEARLKVDSLVAQWPFSVVRKVQIEGHTDSLASDEYNLRLSRRRVISLLEYLVSKGLDPRKVATGFYGEQRPRYLSDTSWAKNRRVEILLYVDRNLLPVPEKRLTDYELKKGQKLRIPRLQFVGNQPVPTWQSMPALRDLLEVMKAQPDLKIEIQGHVCCSDNQELSVERARMVYYFLRDQGIEEERLSYEGFSNSVPLYKEVDERTKALNRRVEIKVLDNSSERKDVSSFSIKHSSIRAPVLDVVFIENSANLAPAGDFMLTLVGEMLRDSEGYNYEFEIFDNIENASLTQRRATTLNRTLRRKGVPSQKYKVLRRSAPGWMPTNSNSNTVLLKIRGE